MTWPDPSDYQDAIQNPQVCFQDPELKTGQVASDPLGLPKVASGNFASVYEVRGSGRKWAVRCFLRQVSDQHRRYSLLSHHLSGVWLQSLVGFEYLDQGILVKNRWHPVVKMEWVDGEGLHTFAGRQLHQPAVLLGLAAQWRGLVNSLQGNGLAHGDLQHGNILVTPNGLMRLVDYDAMFLPSLAGENCPELGHPNFQHPQRASVHYDQWLDNFSALVIYTSLRALAADPGLWQPFHTGENLILSATDYIAPQTSPALQRLRESPDEGVRNLAAAIEDSLGSMARVPKFEQLAAANPPAASSRGSVGVPSAPATVPASQPAPGAPAPSWYQPGSRPSQAASSSPSAGTRPPLPARTTQLWTNRLGMRFVPVPGTGAMFSVWPTRVQDYTAYANATAGLDVSWKSPGFKQDGTHPVVNVNWDDARNFCAWLTEGDRRESRIGPHDEYRLPTDEEWSWAVGIGDREGAGTPKEKDWKVDGVFPWGTQWPPPKGAGNYDPSLEVDTFDFTSPVGSFPANSLGLFDLGGNVWEWCEDWYDGTSGGRVMRGGSWYSDGRAFLLSAYRGGAKGGRRGDVGFRCVIVFRP